MGWPWGREEWGNDCACWPAGRTPKTIYASFRGLDYCWYRAWFPQLPNFQFCLTQVPAAPCEWEYSDGTWMVSYTTGPLGSNLALGWLPAWHLMFGSHSDAPCESSFTNDVVCKGEPLVPYIAGGSGIALSGNNETMRSLQDYAELVNLHKTEDSKADFYPASFPVIHGHFFNREMDTNILMKIDYSEYDQCDMLDW